VARLRTPSPPSFLGKQTIDQADFGGCLAVKSDPLQRQCFLYLSSCLSTPFGSFKEQHSFQLFGLEG